jgi:Txe/YoeB family toxin of Txe-Axe toxin-antitoxin module
MQRRSAIRFSDLKLKERFLELKESDPKLYECINRAFGRIRENAFVGIQIQKRLFPKEWKRLTNLWKYNLADGWRLIYTVAPPDEEGEVVVLAIVLRWMTHKEYEKLFRY